jgi:acid stress-induced BolA-like protein IbaG/YrbA
MALSPETLKNLILQNLPGAHVDIQDLAGDGEHYRAIVTLADFKGRSRVAQHQMVYAALGDTMKGTLHALSIETKIPA